VKLISMKIFGLIFFAFLLIGCGSTKPSEPGKCFVNCLQPDVYEEDVFHYFKYTGSLPADGVSIKESILWTEPFTEWVKERRDDCKTVDHRDCIEMKEVIKPKQLFEYTEVLDTHKVRDFTKDSIILNERLVRTGYFAWEEVMCKEDLTAEVISDIQGYILHSEDSYDLPSGMTGRFDKETKRALLQFQKHNDLPQGGVNLKTVDHFGFELGKSVKPSMPGKCYAKCLRPYTIEKEVLYVNAYTGTESPDGQKIKATKLITEEDWTFTRMTYEGQCKPEYPNDCIQWGLIKKWPQEVSFIEVLDTINIKEFERDSVILSEKLIRNGRADYEEVVCEEDVTSELISALQTKLLANGYELVEGVTGKYNLETKGKLTKYQLNNNLPVKELNIKTMQHLGIY